MRISILLFKPRLRIPFYGLPTIEWNFYIQGITHNISNGFSIFRVIMDKRIENAMNELINTEIWSTGLYLSLQVYFEDKRLPILSSLLNSQAQDNMNKVYQMMNRI
uniref:ferritin-like domain-containing protein n=1 Tax=Bacteroides finegoldii TaxID=338188 RepID=UPI0034A1E1A4